MDPISGIGITVSLLAWLRSEIGERTSAEAVHEVLAQQDSITRYLEWLRRKDHERLLSEVVGARDSLLDEFREALSEVSSVKALVLSEAGDLRERLIVIDETVQVPVLYPEPIETRPSTSVPLKGRDSEIDTLVSVNGDALVWGQPGSGKTAILREIANQTGGLFLQTADPDDAHAALATVAPPVVIVDDAGQKRDLLIRLRHTRNHCPTPFRIIVSCWPFEKDDLQGIVCPQGSDKLVELQPMPRALVAEIVREALKSRGIVGQDWFIGMVVGQARGNPGLATSLALTTIEHGARSLVSGEHLLQDLLPSLKNWGGPGAITLLGCFSLGGKEGVPIQKVAEALGMPIVELHAAVRAFALAGVFVEVSKSWLSVRPSSLRAAAIARAFYPEGEPGLPEEIAIQLILCLEQKPLGYLELARARVRSGADVPDDLLRDAARNYGADQLWSAVSELDQANASWVLRTCEHLPKDAKRAALHFIPQEAIPRILDLAAADQEGPWHSHRDIEILKKWVSEQDQSGPDRRSELCDCALQWMEGGNRLEVAVEALRIVFSRDFRTTEVDPIDHQKISWSEGVVSLARAREIAGLWPTTLDAFKALDACHHLPKVVSSWSRSQAYRRAKIKDDYQQFVDETTNRMITDLIPLAAGHLDMARWLWIKAKERGLEVPEDFLPEGLMALHPAPMHGANWREEKERAEHAATALGETWQDLPPAEVFNRVAEWQKAIRSSPDGPGPPMACHFLESYLHHHPFESDDIAGAVSTLPVTELRVILQYALQNGLFDEDLSQACLARGDLDSFLLELLLTERIPGSHVNLDAKLGDHAGLVDFLCLRNELSEEVVGTLLIHPDERVRTAAALGRFHARTDPRIPDALRERWRSVVVPLLVAGGEGDVGRPPHDLSDMLDEDSELREAVLDGILNEAEACTPSAVEKVVAQLASGLTTEERASLLPRCRRFDYSDIPVLVVGGDVEVFRQLLADPEFKSQHLRLLSGDPSAEQWQAFAIAAVEAGYSAKQVANAVDSGGFSWSGHLSARYQEFVEKFGQLGSSDSPVLQEIGRHGVEWATRSRDLYRERERKEEIYRGYD